MENNAPIFILGMPRCRTAWLSVALMSLGVDCTHEGLRDHVCFETYAAEMATRLRAGLAGDSDPSLVYYIDKLLAQWPEARFLVVFRDENEALGALLAAAPGFAAGVKLGWSGFLSAFKRASDMLRSRATFIASALLSDPYTLAGVMESLTGKRPGIDWARRMVRLKVTTTIEEVPVIVPPAVVFTMPTDCGVDTSGLSAAVYTNLEFEMVAQWWKGHNELELSQAALPPLGVVVSHEGEPWAAVWCYELYGVPVAELTFPVTRPGLSLGDSTRALLYGIMACMHAAGKAHIPQAVFSTFKVSAPKATARYMKRLGFIEYLTERVPMFLTLQCHPQP